MTLITRSELRLVLTTGLVNAFASLSDLPFGYYASLAVLAVCGGTYGASLELGRQRILGSMLGMAVLVIALPALAEVPMPLGLGLALGGMRGIGGLFGLRAGYKVGGMIIVMGWLVHQDQLGAWVPLRLFWTVVGILLSLLSLNLFWPSRSRAETLASLAALFNGLAADLEREALAVGEPQGSAEGARRLQERQDTLQRLRGQLPDLARELGDAPAHHPAFRLVETFEESASRLLGASRRLTALPPANHSDLAPLQAGETALLSALADRLRLWAASCGKQARALPPRLPQPPSAPLSLPPQWQAIEGRFTEPALNGLPPAQLERFAARFTVCRQALLAIECGERGWAALVRTPR
jgi:hypothetical protein